MNCGDHWAKYRKSFRRTEDKTFANDFLWLFDTSFRKNVKSHVFWNLKKNVKYVGYSRTLSRANLIALSTIDMPWRNFLSPEFRKKGPEGSTFIFVDTWIPLKHSVGLVESTPHAKNQIIPFIPLDRTQTRDRRTRTQLVRSLALRRAGKNCRHTERDWRRRRWQRRCRRRRRYTQRQQQLDAHNYNTSTTTRTAYKSTC